MDTDSRKQPARGPERVLCVIAVIFCAEFLFRSLSAGAGMGFYVPPVLIAGFAVGRLFGWLPGGVARGGGGPG